MSAFESLFVMMPAGDSSWWLPVAAVMGIVLARLLTWSVGGLLDSGVFDLEGGGGVAPQGAGGRRWIEAAVVVTVVGLWWWEVSWAGLGPADVDDPQAGGVLLARWAAHAVLFSLLAAAAWIDLRHRVIPDCVTVPGVIVGLAVLWLLPDVLLPIECEVSRSFAMPLRATDVLGWYGGLRSQTPPAWMGAAPHLPGLLIPATVFAAWWSVCTAPFLDPHVPAAAPAADAPSSSRRRIEPRNAILVVGLAAIAAAWWCGGERFLGLQSSLVGLAAAGGLVWSIREGASRALGREAMGLGDVTLMAMVGAWIGWQASVLAFFSAAFIGLAHGLLQVVRHRENELPYGPSLCLASAAVIIGWQPLWQRVGGPFMQPLELIAVIVVVVILTAVTLFGLQRLRR